MRCSLPDVHRSDGCRLRDVRLRRRMRQLRRPDGCQLHNLSRLPPNQRVPVRRRPLRQRVPGRVLSDSQPVLPVLISVCYLYGSWTVGVHELPGGLWPAVRPQRHLRRSLPSRLHRGRPDLRIDW